MSSFSDLKFEPHPNVEGGIIARKEFDNGYGIVVEKYYIVDDRGAILHYTLGSESDLYQIGFTKNGDLFFEDPLPNNYIGAASEEVIDEFIALIENFKPSIVITDDDDDVELDADQNILDYRYDKSIKSE
jgi:hypothetical protein